MELFAAVGIPLLYVACCLTFWWLFIDEDEL